MAALGSNFAFTRVSRNATGMPVDVTTHFLYSEFGTGSNYQNAGTAPDPTLHLGPAIPTLTPASGYQWNLPATSSTHLCLAVEIATPGDPIIPPSLLGRAPGWPLADFSVRADNNKAQRNMGVYHLAGHARFDFFAIVHNASTVDRDIVLGYEVPAAARKQLKRITIQPVGGDRIVARVAGTVVFGGCTPGENRWVRVTVGLPLGVDPTLMVFTELMNGVPVNGFAIAVLAGSVDIAARQALELIATAFVRAAPAGLSEEAGPLADRLIAALGAKADAATDAMSKYAEEITRAAVVLAREAPSDPLGVGRSAAKLKVSAGDDQVAALTVLAHRLDAAISMRLKGDGDVADLAQTMAWQAHLFTRQTNLAKLTEAGEITRTSLAFVDAHGAGHAGATEYRKTIQNQRALLTAIVGRLGGKAELLAGLERMQLSSGSPAALQGAQRAFLLRLRSEADGLTPR